MELDSSLHLLFKFHEDAVGEFQGIKTMEEHIKVYNLYGKMIWGHFTTNHAMKGLWDKKIEIIEKQINLGYESLVFFCDRQNELLFMGTYIASYKRNEIDATSPLIKYIPAYYHHRVGPVLKGEASEESRSYCYIEVDNLIQIDYSYFDDIYLEKDGTKVSENKGMNSKYYCLLSGKTHFELTSLIQKVKHKQLNAVESEELFEKSIYENLGNIEGKAPRDDIPKDVPEITVQNGRTVYRRNPGVVKNAIVASGFCCEIDHDHKTFTSKATKENFVEAHHLIPMAFQKEFGQSLDVEANVVTLCPICHRNLHYGVMEEKRLLLKELYDKRKVRLKNCGIEITSNKLQKYYI